MLRGASSIFGQLLLILALALFGTSASATDVSLRTHLVEAPGPVLGQVKTAETVDGRWTWLSLHDVSFIEQMPARWQLLIDQERFSRIAIVTVTKDGVQHRIERGQYELAENSAVGGLLRFPIPWRGDQIRSLSIGFKDLSNQSLIHKVSAMDEGGFAAFQAKWLFVIGLFAGLLTSAFVYNLFINIGGTQSFTRWYLAWCAAALAYGLVWTSAAAFLLPWLVGPLAMRVVYVLVGSLVGLASMFMHSVLPSEAVPRMLRQLARLLAVSSILIGIVAADERLFNAMLTDRLLNVALAATVIVTLALLTCAARQGNRVSWLLLLAWAPVLLVFVARIARNFGLLPQHDLIDQATFISMGVESLLFSLAIADRFRVLRIERDEAAEAIKAISIETATLRHAAHVDFLTGLGNRASFNIRARQLLDSGTPFKLFLIDLDNMKELNDTHGHAAGDALLQHVARRLAPLVSELVHVTRIGGDEFGVLVGQDDLAELQLSSVLDDLQVSRWEYGATSAIASLSIGVASSHDASTIETLFKYADLALYEAKKRGRRQMYSFNSELKHRIDARAEMEHSARLGLAGDQFYLAYQPIIELESGQCVGAEALLRWNHPSLGLLTPSAFLELFEHNEIGPEIQQKVLTIALQELKKNRSNPVSLSVNFTAMDLRGAASAHRLLNQLSRGGIVPGSLCIEVTEGVLLGRASDGPLEAIRSLHKAGVRVALDDFGTGYASLLHLMQVPVDILKIDRSFISGLTQDTGESEQIVKAVISMGQGMGKKVIAEGIETMDQLARLSRFGCDMGQGYLFGRPSRIPPWQAMQSAPDVVRAVA
jgi:diguanylate cyclase (GGDEF)-like protein